MFATEFRAYCGTTCSNFTFRFAPLSMIRASEGSAYPNQASEFVDRNIHDVHTLFKRSTLASSCDFSVGYFNILV